MLTSALIMTTMEPSASPATCRKTPFMLRLLDPAVAGAWVGAARTSKAVAVASATIRSVRSVAVSVASADKAYTRADARTWGQAGTGTEKGGDPGWLAARPHDHVRAHAGQPYRGTVPC